MERPYGYYNLNNQEQLAYEKGYSQARLERDKKVAELRKQLDKLIYDKVIIIHKNGRKQLVSQSVMWFETEKIINNILGKEKKGDE